MYKVNDTVIYGTQGVCKIEEIAEKDFMGKKREYYVLIPINNPGTTLFAPTDNEVVWAKMRRVLSKDEIHHLVETTSGEDLPWIVNENERKEKFRQIISSGDHRALILMIKAIWYQKKQRETEGKRLHMSDERYLKDAEQLLYDEFQYVLNIKKEDLITYIFKTA